MTSITSDIVARKTAWSVAELYETTFPEPKWAVPGLVPVGLSFLAGRPKLGKSWLALQFAHAVGTGGVVLGEQVKAGKVLYLALEDGPRRLKERLTKHNVAATADIVFHTEWKPLSAGGMDSLLLEILAGGYTFVVVDTLSRALGRSDQMDLVEMTVMMSQLQTMATSHDISILLIDHHTKPKGFDSDPIDDIMGSTGKAAVADVAIGFYKQQGKSGATLKARGRDIEDNELALEWDGHTCCWQCLGKAGDVRSDTLKSDILQAIQDLVDDHILATNRNIARHLRKDEGNISRALADLVTMGIISRGESIGPSRPYELIKG